MTHLRLAPPDFEAMTSQQRKVHDAIASGPRGRVRGPLAIWLHRPELAQAAQALGAYCRYQTTLGPRLSELAILTTARLWTSEFEWWAHKPIAADAGLEPEIIEALRKNRTPVFSDPQAEMVHAVTQTLTEQRGLPDALYDRAVRVLGKDMLVDLVGLCGYYTLISMTINVFGVGLPDGARAEFDQDIGQ